MDPENFGAWYSLAEAYFNTGEDHYKGNAHEAMDQALALNPDDASAHWLMGMIRYFMFDNPEQAIDDFTRAIDLDPNAATYYNYRGVVYLDTGQWELCIADYDRYIEMDPGNPWAYKERGDCFKGLGEIEAVRRDYEQFLEISAGNPDLADLRREIQEWLDSN